MSNCLLFPWVLPLRWSIQIFFYDNNLPGTCMFFIVDTTSIIIYGISLLSVVYKHFDILNLILFMPEEGKPETSWSKKQKRKVFSFHSIQATLVRCLLFCHLFRKCIEKFSYLFSVGCLLPHPTSTKVWFNQTLFWNPPIIKHSPSLEWPHFMYIQNLFVWLYTLHTVAAATSEYMLNIFIFV